MPSEGGHWPRNRRKRRRTLSHVAAALDFVVAAHGHSSRSLIAALEANSIHGCRASLLAWRNSERVHLRKQGIAFLKQIEKFFDLREDYLTGLARRQTPTREALGQLNRGRQNVLRWHLPDNFDLRPHDQQSEIIAWVSANVLPGGTDYGRYQSRASQNHYCIVFPTLPRFMGGRPWLGQITKAPSTGEYGNTFLAPPSLTAEVASIVNFKTMPLPPGGFYRSGQWNSESVQLGVQRYGAILGALAALPTSPAVGLGVPVSNLTLGLMIYPAICDWYLSWCHRRRGFFTNSERNVLYELRGLLRRPTGWVRQHPELADRLRPIPGFVSATDIQHAHTNWAPLCDACHNHVSNRLADLIRVTRTHREASNAIMPVLSSRSPLAEYKKIGDELLKQMPHERREPLDFSLAVRAYLAFRLAIHLGVRQRNLRQLLVCPRGKISHDTRQLEQLRRGELRWQANAGEWHVLIPALAFKNSRSSFFSGKPFQMTLPNLQDLYGWIDRYLKIDRLRLLKGAPDPGTFFVRNISETSRFSPEMGTASFSMMWKRIILRYGIYNPYTGRGAIKGLLPHGHNCVRDVLATHILKQTGSYELASFAIQDNMETVMRHYARFQPHEKLALAAEILNKVWDSG